jgi:hypothetical protein
VTPCCLRQVSNADRLALEPECVDAEAALELLEVVDVVLAALPQAASATLDMTAARTSEARRARRGVASGCFMWLSSRDGW